MKTIVIVSLALIAVALARPEDKYTDKWDKVDLDEILSNRALLTGYVNCLLDKGKCTPDAKDLKSRIADALETKCAKCTDSQKEGSRRVIKHLINNEPEYWQELTAKYDPENKYAKEYEQEYKEIKG